MDNAIGQSISPVPPHPLDDRISVSRQRRYRETLMRRENRLTVVLENCCDPYNAAAVLRNCDAFAVQNVHIVYSEAGFKPNQAISRGTHFYLDIHHHSTIEHTYAELRRANYLIAVADISANGCPAEALVPQLASHPLALVFGNEHDGVSEAARSGADRVFQIPMFGLVDSLNLSVTVALSLHTFRLARPPVGDLSAQEQTELYDRWLREFIARREDRARKRNKERG